MRPEDVPPLYRALVERFARDSGQNPKQIHRWACKLEAPPTEIRRALIEAFFPLLAPSDFLLPPDEDGATITTPMQVQSPQATKIRGVLPTEHPWTKAMRERGISIAEWAKDHKVSSSSARSWIQPGSGGRAIPPKHAKTIQREFGVGLDDWPHGIVGEK